MPGFDISYKVQRVNINHSALDRMLNSPTGDVGRYLSGKGRLIVAAAKAQVGVDTGRLRQSIGMTHYRGLGGQYLRIGSSDSIALIHHQGTSPHTIEARDRHKVMRFTSGGRTIYSRRVLHPGTRPNRYLSDNLRLIRV
jgi:hypothetical protein